MASFWELQLPFAAKQNLVGASPFQLWIRMSIWPVHPSQTGPPLADSAEPEGRLNMVCAVPLLMVEHSLTSHCAQETTA